jgi:fructose-bisphosphate aldolase/6-deoxy-5-ketofructose 1-phosphate synthase
MSKPQEKITPPLTVPAAARETYIKNYAAATHNSGRLFIFSGDQKVEHLNTNFYGPNIASDDSDPEHLFRIASQSRIGAFATQLGLIARYGADYEKVNYIVKLNSKTNLVTTSQADPISMALHTVDEVVAFAKSSGLSIVGVGYTVYLGSEHEAHMMRQAAKAVYDAHQNGLFAVLWMYPRGKAVPEERDANLVAGAAGVGACLGADFVKINPPKAATTAESAKLLKQATLAAGRTKILCAGGASKEERLFLQELYEQMQLGGACGNATGRNIHQKSLAAAVKLCNAIAALVIDGTTVADAEKLLK